MLGVTTLLCSTFPDGFSDRGACLTCTFRIDRFGVIVVFAVAAQRLVNDDRDGLADIDVDKPFIADTFLW